MVLCYHQTVPICNACKSEKDVADFSPDKRKKSGLQGRCKDCQKNWRAQNEEWFMEWRFQKQYGISLSEYKKMEESQNGLCAICEQPEYRVDRRYGKVRRLCVDHNHKTGAVRMLLCDDCNVAVGRLHEDPERAIRMFEYLQRFGPK
jgi:hypothetical protein